MRWLIEYIRSCFCKHDYLREEIFHTYEDMVRIKTGHKVSATCKKCGYHKSYWKY